MDDGLHIDGRARPGFRLSKLEIFNWGTFDSSRGNVHTVRPAGMTTLLIGQNGSGKSTVVDALLTLLVRPVVRNYNVAAGAHKQERDERTYIKGAFGRLGRDEDNRADVQYLRPEGSQYSALLASFSNDQNQSLTVAQVLHLDSEGHSQKVYCLAQGEKSIATDCGNLLAGRMRQQLEKRGFRATTSYSEYHGWLAKATGIRPKAMDMFNQTVAVKDIQSLNRFIREHMLESKPWNEKVDQLQNHFTQLSEAYQSLVRVRRQYELLQPIAEQGATYRHSANELARIERLLVAADSFFHRQTVTLLQPECDQAETQLTQLAQRKSGLDHDVAETREEQRRLKNEMEQAGGERLRTIPLLIQTLQSQLRSARDASARFYADLEAAGLREKVTSEAAMQGLLSRLPKCSEEVGQKIRAVEGDKEKKIIDRAEFSSRLVEHRRELVALEQRQGNLPESFADLRRQICEHLRLSEKDLPFVAELVAIKPEERQWEASIEVVLRSFALSLLVPQRSYAVVSAFVDRTRLADGRGRGQRLVYLRVAERTSASEASGAMPQATSLLRKLKFREGHPLLPWVRAELQDRFNFVCCQTIEEFQSTSQLALTRERHVKMRGGRHEKDDRERTTDPGSFVLGWDNLAKRRHLASEVERLDQQVRHLDEAIRRADGDLDRLRRRRDALVRLRSVAEFSAIEFVRYERQIRDLGEERTSLEQNNDVVRVLKDKLKAAEQHADDLSKGRDEIVAKEAILKQQLREWRRMIVEAEAALAQRARSGELSQDEQSFGDCEAFFREDRLTAANLPAQEQVYVQARRKEADALRKEIEPQKNALVSHMGRYLRDFADERDDLATGIEYLESFCQLLEQIRRDDLPRHEARFKERLNEKVIQEIGLLNGAFQTERTEINSKIELLNQCLRQLEYRPGTYMQLEPRPVRDGEILSFQESLRQCLAGTFEGTPEADEARYMRIEKLLARLREEPRWREKVTDVRKWFDFAARELDASDGNERAYYEDSTGQSGGEKAKLAFTILVAAIAYQYDIDPTRSDSDRFRFVVVDEMFSKVDDQYSTYALELFQQFGLQLLIVAPLDAKARVTEPYVGCYLHVVKDAVSNYSEIYSMTAREFEDAVLGPIEAGDMGQE